MATLYAKVSHHISGRLTLMVSQNELTGYSDVLSPTGLTGNGDALMFYRLVATHFAQLSKEGHQVEYADTSPSP